MRVKTVALVTAICALAVVALARPAESTTINFASLESVGTPVNSYGELRPHGTVVSIDGFIFTSNAAGYALSSWSAGDPSHPAGGTSSTSLFEYLAYATTTITKAGEGSTFDLYGIDFTKWGVNMGGTTFDVTLVGTKTDLSTVTQTVSVTVNEGTPVLQSFVLTGFDDVTKVTMVQGVYGGGTAYQFNNLIVDGEVSSVPDGGNTLSLLGVAGACLIGYRRRYPRA
jgi:hypothetical protein